MYICLLSEHCQPHCQWLLSVSGSSMPMPMSTSVFMSICLCQDFVKLKTPVYAIRKGLGLDSRIKSPTSVLWGRFVFSGPII